MARTQVLCQFPYSHSPPFKHLNLRPLACNNQISDQPRGLLPGSELGFQAHSILKDSRVTDPSGSSLVSLKFPGAGPALMWLIIRYTWGATQTYRFPGSNLELSTWSSGDINIVNMLHQWFSVIHRFCCSRLVTHCGSGQEFQINPNPSLWPLAME